MEWCSASASLREAPRYAERYGPNTAADRKADSLLAELVESVTEPLQLLLIAVGVLSAVFGQLSDAAAIFVVIVVIETTTDLRASRAIDALRSLSASGARVTRGGQVVEVPAAEVVPGDLLVIEAGDVVAADARVLAARGMRVDESSLTGESQPVGKGRDPGPNLLGEPRPVPRVPVGHQCPTMAPRREPGPRRSGERVPLLPSCAPWTRCRWWPCPSPRRLRAADLPAVRDPSALGRRDRKAR